MHFYGTRLMAGVFLLLLFTPLMARGASDETDVAEADSLFREGRFIESEAFYAEIAKKHPDNYQAVLSLGRLYLYENRLEESEKWLESAMKLNPDENELKGLLAEAFYRQDNFRKAAALFREIGRAPMADKLQYLSSRVPYQIESDVDETSVGFVQTDPLPIVKMRVNESEEVFFLIDTGGWELIIDTELADKTGVKKFGGQLATFAGGRKDSTYQGVVDQVKIGDFTIKNVPVNIHNSPQGVAAMLGVPIQGVIGTVFLYHFIFTLDYPEGKLILQRKNEENMNKMKTLVRSKDKIVVPFWMAGDHIMVARGTVNGSRPLMFFVDTGLAGGGFTGTDWLVHEANIQLSEDSFEGIGGGGKVMVKPAVLKEVTLGDAKEKEVTGLFGAMPPDFGEKFGFRIAGIISHGFFRPYKLTFDFTTMNLILEKK
jgi:hypothetical protein